MSELKRVFTFEQLTFLVVIVGEAQILEYIKTVCYVFK